MRPPKAARPVLTIRLWGAACGPGYRERRFGPLACCVPYAAIWVLRPHLLSLVVLVVAAGRHALWPPVQQLQKVAGSAFDQECMQQTHLGTSGFQCRHALKNNVFL